VALWSGRERHCLQLYSFAFYFSSATVTSIAYGDVVPSNSSERSFAALLNILSCLYLAKVFADLNFINSMYNHWTAQRHQRVTQTK
ncbi:unnamed protein product, partial [Polarella glacialis]